MKMSNRSNKSIKFNEPIVQLHTNTPVGHFSDFTMTARNELKRCQHYHSAFNISSIFDLYYVHGQ